MRRLKKYALEEFAPKPITSKKQHDDYVAALLDLERRARPSAEERDFAELLTVLIEAYERENYHIRAATPREVLQELIDANHLKQKDLAPILGSDSIVSEILSGKRPLNKHHIEKLSERFNVSPAVFF